MLLLLATEVESRNTAHGCTKLISRSSYEPMRTYVHGVGRLKRKKGERENSTASRWDREGEGRKRAIVCVLLAKWRVGPTCEPWAGVYWIPGVRTRAQVVGVGPISPNPCRHEWARRAWGEYIFFWRPLPEIYLQFFVPHLHVLSSSFSSPALGAAPAAHSG